MLFTSSLPKEHTVENNNFLYAKNSKLIAWLYIQEVLVTEGLVTDLPVSTDHPNAKASVLSTP